MFSVRHLVVSVAFVSAFLPPLSAFAAIRTWDAGGPDSKWSTAANWSSDTVPTATDIALFDGTGKKDATIDAGFGGSVAELRLAAANTGTITVGRSLTINNNLSLSGGTFVINGGNVVTVKGSWQNGGATFTSNTGTVLLTGSGTSYVLKETNPFKHLSLDDGLVGYWRLNEGTGAAVADSSRSRNNGTFTTPAWSTNAAPLSYTNPASGDFSGLNWVAIPAPSQDQRVTYAAWVYPRADYCNLLYRTSSAGMFIRLAAFDGGHFYRASMKFTDLTSVTLDSPVITYNVWQHLAFTYDGAAVRLYLNGALVASQAKVGTPRYPGGDQSLYIGNSIGGGCGFDGLIDEVRYYNRALSSSEVQALYAGNQGTGSGKYTLGSDLAVNGDLTIYSGTIDASINNYGVTASGSFTNNAGFTPRNGTVTVNGIGTTLKLYGTQLYNVVINAAKSAILRAAAEVTHALTINGGSTFTLNGNRLTATNAFITNNGIMSPGTGSIIHTAVFVADQTHVGATAAVTVTDSDANRNGAAFDTVSITAQGETFTLTETSKTSGVFVGSIPTAAGLSTSGNGILENENQCTTVIPLTYTDAYDGTDSVSTNLTLTENELPGCAATSSTATTATHTGGGGGGNRMISVAPSPASPLMPSAPTPAPAPAAPAAQQTPSGSANATAATRVTALQKRADVDQKKLDAATDPKQKKALSDTVTLIHNVIARLRARMK